jgi:hypothetical protein
MIQTGLCQEKKRKNADFAPANIRGFDKLGGNVIDGIDAGARIKVEVWRLPLVAGVLYPDAKLRLLSATH